MRLEVEAPTSIDLGKSAQVKALAHKIDLSTEDVTTATTWSSGVPNTLQVTASGVATALTTGESPIVARYQNRTASVRVLALPAGTYKLGGRVTESDFPIADAELTVLSGVGAGVTTRSSSDGTYALLGVAANVRLQVRRSGYVNTVEQFDVTTHTTHDLVLTPDRPRPELSGTYELTIGARCADSELVAFPEIARSRTLPIALAQAGPRLTVSSAGSNVTVTGFVGLVEPDGSSSFSIGSTSFYYNLPVPGLIERMSPTAEFRVTGLVEAKVAGDVIAGQLDGILVVDDRQGPGFPNRISNCLASAHQFVMLRR